MTEKVIRTLNYELRPGRSGLPEESIQKLVFESYMPSEMKEADKPFPKMRF